MKRNKLFVGLAALLVAFGVVFSMSAFKGEAKGKRVQYTFRYNGPDHSKANVENESNWIYTTDPITCDDTPEQACSIVVDEAFVNNPLYTPTLKSSLNLAGTPFSSSSAFVSGSDDATMEIVNRAEQ
ncbi:DUF6520 family protein [Pedobacter cryotolerans]|uniref:Uncharacterized protein n=1 Tax=Pedobacter cryotolerans TaxID=2571270 RepID=A0A4U1CBM7_9SPHI|nr:DUF6520 family protein [Pedobacter cryotolerans]TKC03476.1 hypothetical protein FA045_02590 [Pedobacter cryotolerans]